MGLKMDEMGRFRPELHGLQKMETTLPQDIPMTKQQPQSIDNYVICMINVNDSVWNLKLFRLMC